MIHRFHWTAQSDILDAFKDYPGTFYFSFKYSVAHMYSITKPPFIQPLLENLAPGRKTWLTVRNDDIYTFRFGDPAYVPTLYNRLGFVDITALIEKVAADLDLARNWKPGTLKDDGKRSGAEKGFRK